MVPTQQSAILYQSADCEITLIDIPTSIATAQGRSDTLLSTAPLEEPIQTEEYQPRASKAARAAPGDAAHHDQYKALIQQALLDIRAHVSGSWCAPRQVCAPSQVCARPLKRGKDAAASDDIEKELERRFREWAAVEEGKVDDPSFDFQTMMASLGAPEVQPATAIVEAPKWTMSTSTYKDSESLDTSAVDWSPDTSTVDWSPAFYNANSQSLSLTIARVSPEQDQEPPAYHFTLPPHSAYFLSDCDHPESFRSAFKSLTDSHNLPRHFDLVLLDPPWPNRSAKRKAAYDQVGGMPYLKKMLLRMDIDDYLAPNALVGIWITNKPALRAHVLGPGGLFETWNVGLVEEWVWIKTTTRGEPMFDIDDAMRKPYEVLLLGRASPNPWTAVAHAVAPRRRVVAAVPDVHSRKPCLKALLEPFVARPGGYSALEVFARYLVAGWAAWGNEVLKYNSDMYWVGDCREETGMGCE